MSRQGRNAFLALTALLLAARLLPLPGADGRIAHIPAFCPFYELTGWPCPGCGLTRAFVCLAHGQFSPSLHWHPLGAILFGVVVFFWIRAGLTWRRGRTVWTVGEKTHGRLIAAALTGILTVGIGRIVWLVSHHLRY